MSFFVIIPARFGSTRLPGKVLADIAGKPMLQHVYEQALLSDAERILIATDDERVATTANQFGATVCMTATHHQSGTDRLQEVATQQAIAGDMVVVNVQGDEPLIAPAAINQVAQNLIDTPWAQMATLMTPITDHGAITDPHIVKVVATKQGRALYFSRAPIPWIRDANPGNTPTRHYQHIGLYAYRVSLLHQFAKWAPSQLEVTEQLEQLRVLENDTAIHIAETIAPIPAGVNTAEDLQTVRALFEIN